MICYRTDIAHCYPISNEHGDVCISCKRPVVLSQVHAVYSLQSVPGILLKYACSYFGNYLVVVNYLVGLNNSI